MVTPASLYGHVFHVSFGPQRRGVYYVLGIDSIETEVFGSPVGGATFVQWRCSTRGGV